MKVSESCSCEPAAKSEDQSCDSCLMHLVRAAVYKDTGIVDCICIATSVFSESLLNSLQSEHKPI